MKTRGKARLTVTFDGQQILSLPKGLSDRTAIYRLASKKATRDFRGLKYDPKTGKVWLT